MNTPSHLIMTASLERALPRVPILKPAFLLGSVAPDLPLWLLSLGGILYYRLILGWSSGDTADRLFNQLYFHNPGWIAAHSVLHSPVILLAGLALVWPRRRYLGSRWRWLFWFLLACLGHTVVDIFTHADDGPLLLFPFNWSLRFASPVSYWDERHYGNLFQWFELGLDLLLGLYLLKPRLYRWYQTLRSR